MGRRSATHCKVCGTVLTISNTIWKGLGKVASCRTCYAAQSRIDYHSKGWGKKTSEQSRVHNLKASFGITIEEYEKMLEQHQGGCAICRQPCKTGRRLCVDHNHATGEIRGLLCVRCNAVLGQLGDDEDLIWDVLEYLKRTTWKKDEVA